MQAHAAARRILWSILLLASPAAVVAAWLHPGWAAGALLTSALPVTGSALGLLVTGVRWQPPVRPAHRRPRVSLRQLLWGGVFASPFLIAVAQSDPVRLRALDYCGTALLIACSGALALRWWFARRDRQPVERHFYELRQRQAWNEQELGAIRTAVREAFRHADRDDPVDVDEHGKRRRHLRPVRPAVSDDTGPQQAILG